MLDKRGYKLNRFSIKTWFTNAFGSWASGNQNLQKDMNQDRRKIHDAGPNALDIYHGNLTTTSFTASAKEIHAAQLQAEVRMWEQLSLRQEQGITHLFSTLENAITAMNDSELENIATYYSPSYQAGGALSES